MFNILKNLFGGNNKAIQVALAEGATVLDVRTRQEYISGCYPKSVNIPLDQIQKDMEKIKQMKAPIITCCASGMRSASACSILRKQGIEALNGGSWISLSPF